MQIRERLQRIHTHGLFSSDGSTTSKASDTILERNKKKTSNTKASSETIQVAFPSVSVHSFHFCFPCPDKKYYKQWADFWCHDHSYPSRVLSLLAPI